jgi:two-component system sensor histidine kinase BaeS
MHLAGVIDDLQDLSIAESGRLKLDLRSLAVREELERAAAAAAPVARKTGIVLEVDAADALPAVRADALRLGQVLRNLIGNALVHTPRDGRVTIRAHAAGDSIAIEVSDTGAGIDAEHLSHVFERFYRADASRSRETGGAGLGLPIARQLVVTMGGAIEAISEPGRGATFRFTLPPA